MRTRNPIKQTAEDPLRRPCGHWDRLKKQARWKMSICSSRQ